MSMVTYSPVLILIFAFIILCIMMDVHFRDFTPVQKWLIPVLLIVLLIFNQVLRDKIGSPAYAKMMTFTMHIPFFFIFLSIKKCGAVKMIFMILSALVFTAPVIIVSNVVSRVLPSTSKEMLISNIVSYVLMILLVRFVFKKGFNYLLDYGDSKLILLFSAVPIIYYMYVIAITYADFSSLKAASGVIVRYFPTIMVFFFYFLLLYNYRSLSEKRDMEAARTILAQQLNSAEKQVAMLSMNQTQTAVYQHDMRHHLNMIDGLLSTGNIEQAESYIKKVRTDIDAITPKQFCENTTVNLLCSSFADKAEHMGIKLTTNVTLPNPIPISDTELCSIISNGLENAMNAVKELEPIYKKVDFYCCLKLNKLLIEIKNPYKGDITMSDGLPVSNKSGHGYGCRSIRTITEHNSGICEFSAKDNIFKMQVMLPIKTRKSK